MEDFYFRQLRFGVPSPGGGVAVFTGATFGALAPSGAKS
jgi:hypothetical protein